VLREGEVPKKVCFLAEGSVLILRRVGGRPIKVSSLAPGSVIGLDISPNPKKSEFSFKAETDIRCYCIALANIRILPAEWVRRLKE
jgi:CRP-like cAMP-binding protein